MLYDDRRAVGDYIVLAPFARDVRADRPDYGAMTHDHDLASRVANAEAFESRDGSEADVLQAFTSRRSPRADFVRIVDVIGWHDLGEPRIRMASQASKIALMDSLDHFRFEA